MDGKSFTHECFQCKKEFKCISRDYNEKYKKCISDLFTVEGIKMVLWFCSITCYDTFLPECSDSEEDIDPYI